MLRFPPLPNLHRNSNLFKCTPAESQYLKLAFSFLFSNRQEEAVLCFAKCIEKAGLQVESGGGSLSLSQEESRGGPHEHEREGRTSDPARMIGRDFETTSNTQDPAVMPNIGKGLTVAESSGRDSFKTEEILQAQKWNSLISGALACWGVAYCSFEGGVLEDASDYLQKGLEILEQVFQYPEEEISLGNKDFLDTESGQRLELTHFLLEALSVKIIAGHNPGNQTSHVAPERPTAPLCLTDGSISNSDSTPAPAASADSSTPAEKQLVDGRYAHKMRKLYAQGRDPNICWLFVDSLSPLSENVSGKAVDSEVAREAWEALEVRFNTVQCTC